MSHIRQTSLKYCILYILLAKYGRCSDVRLISFSPKYFLKMVRYTVKKCDSRPLYFAQNYPQNAGNAISETQNSQFSGRDNCELF